MSSRLKVIYSLSALFSIAGLITSIYISFSRLSPPEFCELGSLFSCSDIFSSPFSSIFGVSMELYGASWFIVSLVLSIFSLIRRSVRQVLFVWAVLGLLGVAYLVYIEVVVIRTICVLCTVAHVFGILVFSASYMGLRR